MSAIGRSDATSGKSVPRRLQQAIDYVGRQWFPLNPTVAEEIFRKLNSLEYKEQHKDLVEDLKGDFALFSFCLKRLKDLGRSRGPNPLETLLRADFEDLTKILIAAKADLAKHDLSSAERAQALILKQTVLSCSAAELLARSKKSDIDLAFTCALTKQLGLNLVAWNYPSIYTRALSLVKNAKESLEEILEENLGFGPSELASALILGEETSQIIRKAVGVSPILGPNGEMIPSSDNSSDIEKDLVDICEISSAFAQLHDPEHYPHISRSYDTVITQIDEHLGPGGSTSILNFVKDKFVQYIDRVPEVFNNENSLELSIAKVSLEYTDVLFEKNIYAQRCNEKIKKELREVYRHVCRGQVSSMGIGYLVNKVIPQTGFSQGCVYLLDSKRVMLVPKLRIGACSLDRYKAINCALVDPEGSLIVEALYCSMPIKQEGVFLHGDLVSPILGPLGSREPVGVLYLEMTGVLLTQLSEEPLTLFKAIRTCFNDCLSI